MSRYEVDKVLWQIGLDDQERDRFLADPGGYLQGRDLSDEERRALLEHDYAALYALGAHHFILWRWTQAVSSEDPLTLVHQYTEAVKPYGYPDVAT